MRLQESGEMYLETLFILLQKSERVRSLDIAEYMGYSKPSVSRAVGLLKAGGYVALHGEGFLSLTEAGFERAKKIYERHTTLRGFLEDLGVPADIAAADACKMEHVISDETFTRLKQLAESRKK